MHISRESEAETDARLLRVIASADFVAYEHAFAFHESPLRAAPLRPRPDAVAIVRDDDVWSQLIPVQPTNDEGTEPCALFRFHFPAGVDNSGFVGWLATRLKRELGTGVFVVCGQNSARGGIFDYWGCPLALRAQMRHVIESLRAEGQCQRP
jgi:hypothetical protein